MRSIETTQVDNYSQTLLKDRTMTPADRARSAASAMHMHVMTEYAMPIGSALPMTEEDEETMYWHAEHLDRVTDEKIEEIVGDEVGQTITMAVSTDEGHTAFYVEGEQ